MFISSLPVPLDILIFRQRAMKAKKKSSGALPQVPASWRHFGSNLTQYTYIYIYISVYTFFLSEAMYVYVCMPSLPDPGGEMGSPGGCQVA